MKGIWIVMTLLAFGFTAACEVGPRSGAGLRMPNGDVVAGKQAFKDLRCNECHSIAGEVEPTAGVPRDLIIALGGKVAHIDTHGELVTSIINPSHGISRKHDREEVTEKGQSKMTNINERMTVKQLIDLTEYLQSKYEFSPYDVY